MSIRTNCKSLSGFTVVTVLCLATGVASLGPAWGQNRLESELSEALNAQVTDSGLEVRGDARQALAGLIRTGARQLAADGPSKEQLAQARANASVLGREIVSIARRGKRGEVNAADVDAAAKRVCPLYPFCRK